MLLKASPTALKFTMCSIQKGSTLNLADCLKMEFRLMCNFFNKNSDFYEGSYKYMFLYSLIIIYLLSLKNNFI